MKQISTIAIAIGLALLFLLITPQRSEPQHVPEQSNTFEPLSVIEPLPEIEILEVQKRIPEVPPVKHPFRPDLTKAAFELVKLQRQIGATTTPDTWILALEWCESNGDNTAINEVDLDGTASYYAFQFKPSTFRHYGEKYGVIERGLSDQELMNELALFENSEATVRGMMTDPSVIWENQFPDCVRKHIGKPPEILSDMK